MKDSFCIGILLDLIKSTREFAETTKKNIPENISHSALDYAEGYERGLESALKIIYHLPTEEIEKRLNK